MKLYIGVLCFAFIILAVFLKKRGMLYSFIFNGVTGLLTAVAAVCVSPLLGLNMSLNLFTGSVALFFGPSGVAGMLFLAAIWGI